VAKFRQKEKFEIRNSKRSKFGVFQAPEMKKKEKEKKNRHIHIFDSHL
jgi:hypothetical protein